ncbi:MAG: protein kinase domain-containing protein, partial [Kofleriaceae bacterium]
MACPDESELVRFLGGRLAREAAHGLEAHFGDCDHCRQLAFALATGGFHEEGAPAIDAGAKVGRFEIAESIAEGAMGIVYRAHDPTLRRDVALKLVRVAPVPLAKRGSPDADVSQALLLREAQGLAQLHHPNVVTVYEVGTHEGEVFIAMELVAGESLDRWVRRQPRTWQQIVKVLGRAGRGLAAAHAAGLVHRDVKPANVMIANDGAVKVVDFGLARGISERMSRSNLDGIALQQLALTGKVVGTPAYCAPEQLVGGDVDPSSDVFSFCVMCCEALFGRRPYVASTTASLLERMREAPDLPVRPRLPAKLRGLLRRGLAIEREQRLSTLEALLDELAAAPSRFRKRVIVAGVAALAVAAPLLTLAFTTRAADDPCAGTDEPLAGGYSPADDAAIRAGFDATRLGFAAPTAERTIAKLVGWRQRAGALRASTCRAARVDRSESPELFDLRMACLAESTRRVGALVRALERPPPILVEGAVSVTDEAIDLEVCTGPRESLVQFRVPAEPALRARYGELRLELDAATAERTSGRFAAAVTKATKVAGVAHTAGLPAIEAHAWKIVGDARNEGHEFAAARDAWQKALVASEAAGLEELRARLYLSLARAESNIDRREDGARWLAQARAIAPRIADEGFKFDLVYTEAMVAMSRGDYPPAIELMKRAIAERERVVGVRDDLDLSLALVGLGTLQWQAGANAEGDKTLQRAVAMRERLLGDTHPGLVDALNMLGSARIVAGKPSESLDVLRRAFAIAVESAGVNAARISHSAAILGTALTSLGQYDEALALIDRALPIYERATGETGQIVPMLEMRGGTLTDLGIHDRARADLERAVAIRRKFSAPDSRDLAMSLEWLGRAHQAAKRFDDAIAAFTEARSIGQRSPDEHADYYAEFGLGGVYLDAKQPAKALPHFERAIAL